MKEPHVAMIRTKETITGTLYIDGQVVVGKCLFTMPVFEVEAATCNTKHKREQALIDFALEQTPTWYWHAPASCMSKQTRTAAMTSKNKSKKIPCPLCERPCYEGSTDAKLIKSKGVCLRCAFGKSIDQINALLLDKEKNKALKAGTSLPIENFDFSKTKDKGVTVVMTINKSKCVEEMSFEELNTAKIDNNCNCAACQHHKNNDEMKVKSPAVFAKFF